VAQRKRAVARAKARAAKRPNATRVRAERVAASDAGLAATVRALADRRAIEDGLIAYAHALDTRDYARLRSVFKPDARAKFGAADWLRGVDAAAAYIAAALDPLDMSQHRLSSIEVALDGDRASSKAYLAAEHVRGGERYTVGGHYLDAWERTQHGWRIAERQLVTTWTEGNPLVLRGVQLGDEGA
jgi:ketosteroid isomerase-like protein